jgi:hypothetical protein
MNTDCNRKARGRLEAGGDRQTLAIETRVKVPTGTFFCRRGRAGRSANHKGTHRGTGCPSTGLDAGLTTPGRASLRGPGWRMGQHATLKVGGRHQGLLAGCLSLWQLFRRNLGETQQRRQTLVHGPGLVEGDLANRRFMVRVMVEPAVETLRSRHGEHQQEVRQEDADDASPEQPKCPQLIHSQEALASKSPNGNENLARNLRHASLGCPANRQRRRTGSDQERCSKIEMVRFSGGTSGRYRIISIDLMKVSTRVRSGFRN